MSDPEKCEANYCDRPALWRLHLKIGRPIVTCQKCFENAAAVGAVQLAERIAGDSEAKDSGE